VNLYVSNLSPSTTRDDLLKAFTAHGAVSSVSLLTDQMKNGRGVGASRGCGFVVMADKVQARAALAALDRKEIRGSPMAVQVARPTRYSRHRR
jgi:RNA recognition motif-containing protein